MPTSDTVSTAALPPTRHFPTWLVGILYSASGAMNGYVSVSMATLLTAYGVAPAREAEIAALILTASYISFLFAPLVDCGLPRRIWAMMLAVLGAVFLGAGVLLTPVAGAGGGHGAGATVFIAVMLVGYLCTQLYSGTIGGMVPNLVAPSRHAAAGAWLNVAYLGLTGICGSLSAWEVRHLSLRTAAVLIPLPVLLSASPLLWTARENTKPQRVAVAMRAFSRNVRALASQRSFLFAMAVFLVPSATFALQNLFGGMGRDFGASDDLTATVSGVGLAIACIIGSALGAPLSERFDRRLLFVGSAVVAAVGSLAMILLLNRHVAPVAVFVVGVCFYNLLAGINYTAFSALTFQIVGRDNPLSATQYSLCTATANVAIAGAVALDGHGANLAGGWSGARGELLVDALLSVVLGAAVLAVTWRFGGGFPRPSAASAERN